MMIEHLTLIIVLKLPFIIVISKSDLCPENILKETINEIKTY